MAINLDAVKACTDPTERAVEAEDYLGHLRKRIDEVMRLRDDAIRASDLSAPKIAERTALSIATIRVIRRGRS